MRMPSLTLFGLQAQLTLIRFGWGNSIACVLCAAGIVGWLWLVPHLREQAQAREHALALTRQKLQSANSAPPVILRPVDEERMEQFYDTLGEKRYAEQQVKTLFEIARKTGLNLNQAEYKLSFDKSGRYHAYQVLLPVNGSYESIRRFCEQTLLAIPFASLNEMNFKRDAIASRTLEAKLRFTLYLADASTPVPQKVASTVQDSQP